MASKAYGASGLFFRIKGLRKEKEARILLVLLVHFTIRWGNCQIGTSCIFWGCEEIIYEKTSQNHFSKSDKLVEISLVLFCTFAAAASNLYQPLFTITLQQTNLVKFGLAAHDLVA